MGNYYLNATFKEMCYTARDCKLANRIAAEVCLLICMPILSHSV